MPSSASSASTSPPLPRPARHSRANTSRVASHPCDAIAPENRVHGTVIAVWLGHESVESTQMYIQPDIELKEKAMAKTQAIATPPSRNRPSDELLAFLEALESPISLALVSHDLGQFARHNSEVGMMRVIPISA